MMLYIDHDVIYRHTTHASGSGLKPIRWPTDVMRSSGNGCSHDSEMSPQSTVEYLYSYGHIWLWPYSYGRKARWSTYTVMAIYGYGHIVMAAQHGGVPIHLWPYMVMAI